MSAFSPACSKVIDTKLPALSKKLTLIRYPCPSPYSTVSLNHLLDRIQDCRRYPLFLDTLPIRSFSREVEIASGFHFQL